MNNILIAGAGPVGLAAGLFLKRDGANVRIVDPLLGRTPQSRALAINPRTLALLEETGLTQKILERGAKVTGLSAWQTSDGKTGKQIIDIDFTKLSLEQGFDKYPFLIALSQSTTEKLLAEALGELGVQVQRGWSAAEIERREHDDIQVTLESASDKTAEPQVVRVDGLIAADGAHSTIRKQLEISFDGTAMKEDWHLADLPLHTELDPHRAHLCFFDDGGFTFMLRVVHDARVEPKDGALWRVMCTRPLDFDNLFKSKPAGPVAWQSGFHVSHRIASDLQKGNIFLMGDAAHVHSPAGARGMNLGIEDAWTLADLRRRDRLEDYGHRRREIDAKVVDRVDTITKAAVSQADAVIWARTHLLPMILHVSQFKKFMFKTMSGQDHRV